jgi:hypothetical protein
VYQRLKVIIPTLQMLTAVGVLIRGKMARTDRTLTNYVLPARHLVLNLDLPLVPIWWLFIYPMEWLSDYLPFLQKPSAIGFGLGMTLLTSIGLFWYFVVVEVQLRVRGQSLVRFSSRIIESGKVFILFLGRISTFFYGYTEAIRPFQHGLARYGLWPVEIALTVFFLAIWGAPFIGISIYDSRKCLMTMRKSGSQLGGAKS